MTYYIYHILGFKIGATHDWTARTIKNKLNYPNSEMVLLETIEDDYNIEAWQRVGDREWELADEYGYPRGTHYKIMVLKASKGGIVTGRLNSESGFFKSLNSNRTQESRDNAAVSISIALKQKYSDGYISPKTGIPIKEQTKQQISQTLRNFTDDEEAEIFNKYIPYKYGHGDIAKEYGIHWRTSQEIIKRHKKRVSN
tara:strand:+ start:50 stop:643 length:594 start_codon:yes stop_codon:yes gene_type:complete